jgi:uracil-DNA glycosylase
MRAMHTVTAPTDFDSWRSMARRMITAQWHPDDVLWDAVAEGSLFGMAELPEQVGLPLNVSKALVDQLRTAAAHRDPQRWAVLYRLLWRWVVDGQRHLLNMATDPDIRRLQDWLKAVGRDIHKMHAFVRFRQVGVDEVSQREQFVAWFEPDNYIVRLATPFFQKRFTSMDWSILTPDECAHWDGERLHFTPGVSRDSAPADDALDDLWRTYYKSIFNPARLKVKMMQQEMPKKYWKNLPEAELISELIADSSQRVQSMLDTEERPVKPAPKNAYLDRLHAMNQEPCTE